MRCGALRCVAVRCGALRCVAVRCVAVGGRKERRRPMAVRVSEEVRAALAAGGPVVALESTIITHGMPWPENYATAVAVEAAVREGGATPATVAILGGELCVGLEDAQLRRLARWREDRDQDRDGDRDRDGGRQGMREVRKTSRRDLAAVVASGCDGSTTVSGTMVVARMAGIEVFVTGGIGGVHRGAEDSMDVSADLTELGRTRMVVVCAGVKSILDIPRTLEVLETQGVGVVCLGADEFPAFFTRRSGIGAPLRVDSVDEVAAMASAAIAMDLGSGMLVAVPVPERDEARHEPVERAIQEALREAEAGGIVGAAITPFLLRRIGQLTGGESLAANVALIKNNARVGAEIAAALAARRRAARDPPSAAALRRSGRLPRARAPAARKGGLRLPTQSLLLVA